MRVLIFILAIFIIKAQAIGVGEKAPDFSYASLDHGTQKLSDYTGKVVYLFFLGYGCPPCINHAPIIQKQIYEKYSRDEVVVIGLDAWNGSSSQLRGFQSSTQVDWPLLLKASAAQSNYDIPIQDYTVIVDQNGYVAHTNQDYPSNLDTNESMSVIDKLLTTTNLDDTKSPYKFELKTNYPNPFNPVTTIPFTVNKTQNIKLEIFNITGRKIRTLVSSTYNAGSYKVQWDGTDDAGNSVSSGIYFYNLKGESLHRTQQMQLVK